MISKKVQVLTDTVKQLLHCNADESLSNILAKAHAADVAYVLSQCDIASRTKIFSLLRTYPAKGEVLAEMREDEVSPLLESLGAEESAKILEKVSPEDTVDIMEVLPKELSSEILLHLKKEEAEEVEELIGYPSDTAGGIMSPDVLAFSEETRVAQAIEKIQKSEQPTSYFYVYVTNVQGHLVGVLSLKKLILASPLKELKEIMDKDPIRVRLTEDQEEVAKTVSRYDYLSVPVVDDTNKLVGVITVDDVIDVIQEEAAEDMLLIAGADKEAIGKTSFWGGFRKRLPWLLATLVGGLIASEIIHLYFSPITAELILLAGFIPVFLGMGSAIGRQSMTVIVSLLSAERVNISQLGGVVLKELRLALAVGLVYGLVLGFFIFFRFDYPGSISLGVGTTLVLTMLLSACIGSLVPLLFQKAGLDPAIVTGTFVTSLIHIFCIWVYFAMGNKILTTPFW